MQLLYFGWVRTKIGVQREDIDPPPEVADVRGLVAWLQGRGPGYAEALNDPSVIRVAVNQELGGPDTPVKMGDEVALFPPMTGG